MCGALAQPKVPPNAGSEARWPDHHVPHLEVGATGAWTPLTTSSAESRAPKSPAITAGVAVSAAFRSSPPAVPVRICCEIGGRRVESSRTLLGEGLTTAM